MQQPQNFKIGKSVLVSRRAYHGFTLVELLVVIAIISLLAAILFPVFARARENARRTSCLSNLKQQGLAIVQYTQDYDERYPPYTANDQADRSNYAALAQAGWAVLIQPYLKSTQVNQCPSDPWKGEGNLTVGYTDYIFNARMCITPGVVTIGGVQTQPSRSTKLSELTYPSCTLTLMDSISINQAPYGASFYYIDDTAFLLESLPTINPHPTYVGYASAARRHLEGANYAFADGHAKWYKPEQIDAAGTPKGNNVTFKIR